MRLGIHGAGRAGGSTRETGPGREGEAGDQARIRLHDLLRVHACTVAEAGAILFGTLVRRGCCGGEAVRADLGSDHVLRLRTDYRDIAP